MTRQEAQAAAMKIYEYVPSPRHGPNIQEAAITPNGLVNALVALGVLKIDEEAPSNDDRTEGSHSQQVA